MPGVLVQFVTLARKDQQLRRNTLGMQGALQKISFANIDSNIFGAGDDVSRGLHLIDLPYGGFIVVILFRLPGETAQKVRVVECSVVVAPIGDVFNRARTGDSGFEARGLRDEPVGQVAAVAITADS